MFDTTGQALFIRIFGPRHWQRFVDTVLAAVVVVLPWSTSATAVLIVVWLAVVFIAFDIVKFWRILATPAGGIPILLCVLVFVGTLWASDATWTERWIAATPFARLLLIPVLMARFQDSENAHWVIPWYIVSCGFLLAVSWLLIWQPDLPWPWTSKGEVPGIPVKDYVAQSSEFTLCAFFLAGAAVKSWHAGQRGLPICLSLLAVAFLVNVLWVTPSRTPLIVIPALIALTATRCRTWIASASSLAAFVVIGALLCVFVAPVKQNIIDGWREVREFQPEITKLTRIGERLEFWRRSILIIENRPLIGHGTGSIRAQFQQTAGVTGMTTLVTANPHNQTFQTGIQLGLIGIIVLYAMWLAHVLLFIGGGFAGWAGSLVVIQSIVTSLFNSQLLDFTSGSAYVIAVGVAGGVVLRQTQLARSITAASESRPNF